MELYTSIDTSLNHERDDIKELDCEGISSLEWIRYYSKGVSFQILKHYR